MNDIDLLLEQARDDRGKTVIKCHVDLVKAHAENKRLGGEVDCKSILSAIVDSYGTNGVKYSLVREVLHDTEELNAAVKDLVDAKEITTGEGKRDFLLTTTKIGSDQTPSEQPDENDGDDDTGVAGKPPAAPPAKPSKPKEK